MKLAADALLAPTPAAVRVAVQRIAAACQPEVIFAFGSRSRRRARVDSDLDLFVLLNAPSQDHGALRRSLRALLADFPFSKDILVSDSEKFALESTRTNGVYRDIAEHSIPLWRDGCANAAAIDEVCR